MLNQAIAKGNQNLVACCSPADVLFLLPAEWKSTNKGNEMKSKVFIIVAILITTIGYSQTEEGFFNKGIAKAGLNDIRGTIFVLYNKI